MEKSKKKNVSWHNGIGSMIAVFLVISFAVVFAFASRGVEAHDADTLPCEPITGIASGIPSAEEGIGSPGGIENSGRMDFNGYETSGAHAYRACIRQDVSQKIEGWAWNTNWGDVSFACNSGTNFGAACGSMNYGSSAYTLSNGKIVIAGYAYSENLGWLSLACQNFDSDPELENFLDGDPANTAAGNELSCGAIPYGSLLNEKSIAIDDVAFGGSYGWTNSVGWIRFTGVKFPAAVIRITTDPPPGGSDGGGVSLIPLDPATFLDPDAAVSRTVPFADGKDGYRVLIKVTRGGTIVRPGPNPGDISGTPTITSLYQNNIVFDQLGFVQTGHNHADSLHEHAGHMTSFTWSDVLGGYVSYITSVAPTNSLITSTFHLDSVNVSGLQINGDVKTYDKLVSLNRDLAFNPAVEISELNSKDPNTNSFQPNCATTTCKLHGSRNSPNELKVKVKRFTAGGSETHPKGFVSNAQIKLPGQFLAEDGTTLYSALPATSRSYDLYYFPDTNLHATEVPILDDTGQTIGTTIAIDATPNIVPPFTFENLGIAASSAGQTPDALLHSFYAYLPQTETEVPEFQSSGARLKMRIEYILADGTKVSYAGKELFAGDIFNQFARFFGSTNIEEGVFQEVTKIRISDTEEESAGTPSLQRGSGEDFVLKVSKKLQQMIKGKKPRITKQGSAGIVTLTETQLQTLVSNIPDISDKILLLTRGTVNGISTTEPFSVILKDDDGETDGLTALPELTLVIEGGNVFIDNNLMSTIGLVLLEDPAVKRSGRFLPHANINVCASVTEIHASIRAEGSLLSYGRDTNTSTPELDDPCGDKSVDSKGFPAISPISFERQILKNQLSFIGPISACFTSGGSTLLPPIMCDGTRALTSDQIQKAKRQDVNYLRYAKVTVNPDSTVLNDPTRPDKYWWADDVEVSPSLGDKRPDPLNPRNPIPTNYPPKFGIVNFLGGERTNLPLID